MEKVRLVNNSIPVEILIDNKKNGEYEIHKIEKINVNIQNDELNSKLDPKIKELRNKLYS